MAATDRFRRSLDLALALAFVAGLFASGADLLVRPMEARSPVREQRQPAKAPTWPASVDAALRLPERTERWWNDWFGLRDVLIRARNAVYWHGLRLAPSPQIVRGRDGWVYFDGTNRALQADRGANPLSPEALAAWKRVLDSRRAWCEARGIQLVLAIVPSKAWLYPERLPAGYARIGPARFEQVRAALGEPWDDAWVDLAAVLGRERALDTPDDPSFAPLGTHWSDRTALAAYRAIVATIARRHPGLAPRSADEFAPIDAPLEADSWAGRMYLDGLLEQRVRTLRPVSVRASADVPTQGFVRELRLRCPGAPLGRAYVLHDSFGPELRTWLAEHFRETWSRWRYDFDPREIEAYGPDVVVLLFSDRYFLMIEPALGADDLRAPGAPASEATQACWRLDPARDAVRLHAHGRLELRGGPDGIAVRLRAPSDFVELPRFDCPDGGALRVRIVVDSPIATSLDLFFQTRAIPSFTRAQTVTAQLEPGRNELALEIPARDVLGVLGLRPGFEAGEYLLRELEIRR